MIRTLLWRSGFVFVALMISAPSWAAPVVFCEFAALPPSEALERLAESYQGLLEFGGEAFSPDGTSLEKLFELSLVVISVRWRSTSR